MKQGQITVLQMLPELDSGGVERGTLDVGRWLAENGHRSLVISGGGKLVEQLEQEGSHHITMAIGRKSLATLRFIPQLRRLLRQQQIDILHLRSRVPAWVAYLAWKSLPVSERPALVTTFHGFYSVNGYSAIMAKGEAVIAVSEAIAAHIAENYDRNDKVVTIHRGVDIDEFSPEHVDPARIDSLRQRWRLRQDLPVIMLPGRITRLKGHKVFLEAIQQLAEGDLQAVLIGDPAENAGYADELRQMIETGGLKEKVRMVGHCQDMAAAYMLADLVVSATAGRPESFGRVSAEAMAMGKPVVATAHGGSLEIIEDGRTGWLVAPNDAEAMAAAIGKALSISASERQVMGAQGRKRVLSRFTTTLMCQRTLELYRSLLAEKTSGQP